MKNFFFGLLVCCVCFISCKSDTNNNKSIKDLANEYKPFDGQSRPLVYNESFTTKQGYKVDLFFRGGSINAAAQIVVEKDGLMIYNKDRKAVGRVKQVIIEDLNNDQIEDFFFWTITEDVTAIGNAYGLIIQNPNLKPFQILPNMEPPLDKGYLGRDSFYIMQGQVYRSFPIFSFNKYNQKESTDLKRVIKYDKTNFKIESFEDIKK